MYAGIRVGRIRQLIDTELSKQLKRMDILVPPETQVELGNPIDAKSSRRRTFTRDELTDATIDALLDLRGSLRKND